MSGTELCQNLIALISFETMSQCPAYEGYPCWEGRSKRHTMKALSVGHYQSKNNQQMKRHIRDRE